MGARAEQGPAFDSQELDALQFDLQDVLVGNVFDAAFRIARSAGCVNGYRESRGSQCLRVRMVVFVGRRPDMFLLIANGW